MEALEELAECLPSKRETEQTVEAKDLGRACNVFLRRYWYAEPLCFYIYINKEIYYSYEREGVYTIRPRQEAGGVFVLSASCFVEATEGHGARFVDMMHSFVPYIDGADYDGAEYWIDWQKNLLDAGERLAEAVFANDLSGVADLLADGAEVYGYGEDVSGDVSVASIDYSTGCDVTESGAVVSVKHRLGGEESYRFLTMELEIVDWQMLDWRGWHWKATWIGLEE